MVKGVLTPPLVFYLAALEVLPLALQFLGLGGASGLGQGLCGSLLSVTEWEAVRYGLASGYLPYERLFLLLLALKANYALALVLFRFMYEEPPPWEGKLWQIGLGLSWSLLLGVLVTRTLPLPTPTPLGLALLPPAPLDLLAVLMALPDLLLLFLFYSLTSPTASR